MIAIFFFMFTPLTSDNIRGGGGHLGIVTGLVDWVGCGIRVHPAGSTLGKPGLIIINILCPYSEQEETSCTKDSGQGETLRA